MKLTHSFAVSLLLFVTLVCLLSSSSKVHSQVVEDTDLVGKENSGSTSDLNSNVALENVTLGDAEGKVREFKNKRGTKPLKAQFLKNGQFRIYTGEKNWVLHRFMNAFENKNKIATLVEKDWNDPVDDKLNGVDCKKYVLDTTLRMKSNHSVQVSFVITAFVFDEAYTIKGKGKDQGKEISGAAQSVKFSYSLGAWPFDVNSSGLFLNSHIKSTGNSKGNLTDGFKSGDASFLSPITATIDGVETEIEIRFGRLNLPQSPAAMALIQVKLPVYTSSVEYDPIVALGDESTGSDSAAFGIGVNWLIALIVSVVLQLLWANM